MPGLVQGNRVNWYDTSRWCQVIYIPTRNNFFTIYYSVRKVSDLFYLFFSKKPGEFQWSKLAWGDLEASNVYMIFSRLSIASVDHKQNFCKILFSSLVRYSSYRYWRMTGAAHLTFLVKNQTPVVHQAPYSPDIRRYRQKSLNQVRCSSRSVIFLTMKIRREHQRRS